jgi:hypothetical protein
VEDDTVLRCLLGALSTLRAVSRAMHPGRVAALIETLGDRDARLTAAAARSKGQVPQVANLALQSCARLRAAHQADNPTRCRPTGPCASTAGPWKFWATVPS